MTSANEKWWAWMEKYWPNATDATLRLMWDFWCQAIAVGRSIERERGPEPVRPDFARRAAGGAG